MRRRAFIEGIAAFGVAWPLTPRARHQERVRLVGVLMNLAANDAEASARISAFVQRLSQLGWTEGRTNRLSLGSRQERMV
jgi:ABC-type Na+ transport system ATPase subunit NatA